MKIPIKYKCPSGMMDDEMVDPDHLARLRLYTLNLNDARARLSQTYRVTQMIKDGYTLWQCMETNHLYWTARNGDLFCVRPLHLMKSESAYKRKRFMTVMDNWDTCR